MKEQDKHEKNINKQPLPLTCSCRAMAFSSRSSIACTRASRAKIRSCSMCSETRATLALYAFRLSSLAFLSARRRRAVLACSSSDRAISEARLASTAERATWTRLRDSATLAFLASRAVRARALASTSFFWMSSLDCGFLADWERRVLRASGRETKGKSLVCKRNGERGREI